ncbi:MAG TPA: DNA mismatch repair protein MutL, partial [Bacteroidetes bacterium]|nr:DNA mismatch repair protein MutL [Bacteroidota bacterium]
CFERHATSKIKDANDIFNITTKGFRGEAMASIAAIAHVELITRREIDDLGNKVVIIGSKVTKQEPIQSEKGTKISVKNLFFNVPARRKFLKSDAVEFKHIVDEFQRLALAHPSIEFNLYHNGKELYRLLKSTLKQRIVNVFGKGMQNKLLQVEEITDLVTISGYIGKIDATRKSRTNQFIFINNRYVKNNYLAHAVKMAYDEYIPEDQNPLYFLYLTTDPSNIDVNIHPTKQEVKFEDDRLVYNYIRVVLKKILGKFHHTPTLDFNDSDEFTNLLKNKNRNSDTNNYVKTGNANWDNKKNNQDDWEKAFQILHNDNPTQNTSKHDIEDDKVEIPSKFNRLANNREYDSINEDNLVQIQNSYIARDVKDGLMLIDQFNAHSRILYEQYLDYFSKKSFEVKQLLFPVSLNLNKDDLILMEEYMDRLESIGFIIENKNDDKYEISGIPAILDQKDKIDEIILSILEKESSGRDVSPKFIEKIAYIFARKKAKNKGKKLSKEEMDFLVKNLFLCKNPYKSPSGRKTFTIIKTDEILNRFN